MVVRYVVKQMEVKILALFADETWKGTPGLDVWQPLYNDLENWAKAHSGGAGDLRRSCRARAQRRTLSPLCGLADLRGERWGDSPFLCGEEEDLGQEEGRSPRSMGKCLSLHLPEKLGEIPAPVTEVRWRAGHGP